jgi:hypothetical protein
MQVIEEMKELITRFMTFTSVCNINNDKVINNFVSLFKNVATKWNTSVKNLSKVEKKKILRDNIQIFYKIHSALVGYHAQIHCKSLTTKFRGSHDIIFKAINIIRPATVFAYLPTKLFTEFCKGITYFRDELITERPAYHRMKSCGTGQKNIIDKFKKALSEDSAIINKDNLKRCYIERLIYDNIYTNILHLQDPQHYRELKEIERLYQDYFRENVNIRIKYQDNFYPIELIITYTINETKIIIEKYKKNINSNIVECTKITSDGMSLNKKQSFDHEEQWESTPIALKALSN